MLYGREETPPRRGFCVSYVNGNLGNIVGSMFVRRHFDHQSKEDVSGPGTISHLAPDAVT